MSCGSGARVTATGPRVSPTCSACRRGVSIHRARGSTSIYTNHTWADGKCRCISELQRNVFAIDVDARGMPVRNGNVYIGDKKTGEKVSTTRYIARPLYPGYVPMNKIDDDPCPFSHFNDRPAGTPTGPPPAPHFIDVDSLPWLRFWPHFSCDRTPINRRRFAKNSHDFRPHFLRSMTTRRRGFSQLWP